MATKKDLLDVLRADVSILVEDAEGQFGKEYKKLTADISKAKERVDKTAISLLTKFIKKNPIFCQEQGYRKLLVNYSGDVEYKKLKGDLEAASKANRKKIQEIRDKADRVTRKIRLHGASAEVIEMIESLHKA